MGKQAIMPKMLIVGGTIRDIPTPNSGISVTRFASREALLVDMQGDCWLDLDCQADDEAVEEEPVRIERGADGIRRCTAAEV